MATKLSMFSKTSSRVFPGSPARGNKKRRALILGGLAVSFLAAALTLFTLPLSAAPAGLDLGTTQTSQNGHFTVRYEPPAAGIPVGQPQSWTLFVETPQGGAVEGATLAVDGEMPDHGHGFTTLPPAPQALGGGRYRLEGLELSMGGWWVLSVTVTAGDVEDTVRFNVVLE